MLNIVIYMDSSAAKGIASRTRLGKRRHIAVHLLWLQEQVRSKTVELMKVKGTGGRLGKWPKFVDLRVELPDLGEPAALVEMRTMCPGRAATLQEVLCYLASLPQITSS